MTPEQIEHLGPAFADYLQQFLFCCGYTQTFDLLDVYCRGLLSDLKRKTCEPIALVRRRRRPHPPGVPPRSRLVLRPGPRPSSSTTSPHDLPRLARRRPRHRRPHR